MPQRVFFPLDEAAPVSPTIDASVWNGHIQAVRRKLRTTADASTLTTLAYTPDAADHAGDLNTHHRQYVSDVVAPQTFAAQAIKAQFQILEANAANNLFLAVRIIVANVAGDTVLGTILALTRDNSEPGTTLINRQFTATSTALTINESGRIVVEVGLGGSPGSGGGVQGHNGSMRWGGTASSGDLPEDDTTTATTYRPWLEFANAVEFGYGLNAEPSSYAVTGAAATPLAVRMIDAGPGSYALTGLAADLAHGFPLNAEPGSYVITGAAAGLLAARLLDASSESYIFTGVDAGLLSGHLLSVNPGTYVLTGFDVTPQGPVAAFVLVADPGAYAVAGTDAGLLAARMLAANPGAYLLTGIEAATLADRMLDAGAGVYVLTGADATLLQGTTGYLLNAAPGIYALVGADGTLVLFVPETIAGPIAVATDLGRTETIIAHVTSTKVQH